MTVVEIASLKQITVLSPVLPFIYEARPVYPSLAPFWTDTFGAADDSTTERIFILSFVRDFLINYTEVSNFIALQAQEKSFFWDNDLQILQVHFEHDQEGLTDIYEYGTILGFTDNNILYVDGIEYSPLITGVPSFAQQQDLINYDQLSFINGSITLRNEGRPDGELDKFITEDIYGNDAFIYYLDDDLITDPDSALRSDLVPIASVYIEDYDINLTEINLKIQDQRKAQNVTIPTDVFSVEDYPDIEEADGDIIPVMYGTVRRYSATPTNDITASGDVYYRVALLLTALGTVEVNIDGIWTVVTPSLISLSTGEFVLASADGRETSGSIREARVLLPEGIPIDYTSDIIVDLNNRYLGIEFLDLNYDLSEWNFEKLSLSSGGWVFDEEILLFDAIRIIQNGSNVGFRYEITPDNKRTIRIDKNTRIRVGRVEPVDIQNRSEMPVTTDSDLVFSAIKVNYNKAFDTDKFQSITNDDFKEAIKQKYRQQNTLPVDTILNTEEAAAERALLDATNFSIIPSIMKLDLMGKNFLTLRIFDILDLEATPDFADADNSVIVGRQYYGFKRVKVISINPNTNSILNSVDLQLLDDAIETGEETGEVYGLSIYGIDVYGG